MTLQDLSPLNRRILDLLTAGDTTRRQLVEATQSLPQKISRCLNRLEAMGFVEKTTELGGWTITAAGRTLYGCPEPSNPAAAVAVVVASEPAQEAAEAVAAAPEMSAEMSTEMSAEPDEPEPDFDPAAWTPEPISAPPPRADHDAIAADLLVAMEIEVALDQYRARVRAAPIPARAVRVYREVLAPLPPVLREALEPITALVEAS